MMREKGGHKKNVAQLRLLARREPGNNSRGLNEANARVKRFN
jgi:hypothetical protein